MTTPRALLAELFAAAVEGAAPFPSTRSAVQAWFAAHPLVATQTPVHVIAVGKAGTAMAAGAIDALNAMDRPIQSGLVVTSHAPTAAEQHGVLWPANIVVHCGDHPVPGPASLDAADAIGDALLEIEPGHVVVVLVSGGTTALCAAPISALTLAVGDADRAQAHIANLAQTLLESGLAIHEMNAIRRRILRWGAGRLAVAIAARGATHIPVFAISDVIGDDPAVIGSGPCSADPLDDAAFLALLDAHAMRGNLERAVGTTLGIEGQNPPPAVAPATHPAFSRVTYTLVARNQDAVAALAERARALGIESVLVEPTPLEGDAATLGDVLARRVVAMSQHAVGPTLIVCGGEPVVNLRATIERAMARGDDDDASEDVGRGLRAASADEPLRGGRMQVLALAAALALEEAQAHGQRTASRITILAAGTDGRDGPTDAAGAIVDAAVPALARRAGRSPEDDLATGRSWFPLHGADALLRTGPTGTNVMDVVAVLIA